MPASIAESWSWLSGPSVIRSLSLPGEGKSLAENIATINEEFSRTVAFYNSSHQQAPLDSSVPVFVSGDLVKIRICGRRWWVN